MSFDTRQSAVVAMLSTAPPLSLEERTSDAHGMAPNPFRDVAFAAVVMRSAAPDGKAERFIQTCLREWVYGRARANSHERTEWLPAFLSYDNTRRPNSALDYKPPASRLDGNDILQLNS